MKNLNDEDKNKLLKWIDEYIDKVAISQQPKIESYVSKLREQNEKITNDKLVRKIIMRKSYKNGLVGAATGIGGLITLPATVPIDLVASWKIQIYLTLVIAHIYGHTNETTDLKTDIYLILAGNSSTEFLKKIGIETGKAITKKAIEKNITREVMKKIWKVIPQKIITKAGQKSMTSFTKMVPMIGAPIGFGFDYFATRTVGKMAIKYYSK